MTLIDENGSVRERKLDIIAKLQENGIDSNLITQFQYPPDIAKTGFLQIERSDGDDNLWIYLPALNKTRRLVAKNKKDSFFGSDFSYGDILPPRPNLFVHSVTRSEILNDHDCYVIESTPKDENEKLNRGYGKKISWIRKDNYLESKIEFYDMDGKLFKTQFLDEHKQIDQENQKWIATQREMIHHETGHKTKIVLHPTDVNKPIDDDFFTTNTLER